ncbi:MAG: extracellular solute-binding protein [Clostridia bacterium]|nr:extracellular solute-binding protein [Clostridia bacterium]MBR0228289.1 extracellular solute-binding protein [Clostridia bacterium]
MKKLVALFLALVMTLSLASFAAAEEPFEITVMLPEFAVDVDYVEENNPVLQAIQDATGVKLKIQYSPNSTYGDIMNTTLADKNPPMLMALTDAKAPSIIDAARAGAFWDLTDFIADAENYPYLAAGQEGLYKKIAVDGRIYGIYRSRAYPRAGIYYRLDIAKEVGFDRELKTVADLTELAEKLAGYSEDTYALNMIGGYVDGTINIITVAMGAPNTWGVDENGDIYPAFKSPAYLEGLNWLRHLYEIGGIDPNFIQISTNDWNNIERTGKAFMRFDCMDNGYRQQEWFETNAGVTEQIFEIAGPLAKEDGSITIWPQTLGFAGEIVVTKSVSEADLPKVVKFLDWCNSAEGQTIINAGLEGFNYWVNEDGYRYVPEEKKDEAKANQDTYWHDLNQLGMGVPGNLENPPAILNQGVTALRELYAKRNEELTPYAVTNPCADFVSETYTAFGAQLDPIIKDAAMQYIAGLIGEDELRAAWEEWAAMGGDMITAEYNEQYHAAQK